MRYMLIAGEDETGHILTGPSGGLLVYDNFDEVTDVAKRLCKGLQDEHPGWGVFVCKIVPAAFYLPVSSVEANVPSAVDETIIPSKEPDAN